MAVTKRTRFEVLKRDNYTCRYCRSTEGKITIDHVLPVALGGTDSPDNLVAACSDCNAGKSSTSPTEAMVEDVSNATMKWQAAMIQAAKIHAESRKDQDEYADIFQSVWVHWSPKDWRQSVESLRKAGLPASEMVEAVMVADSARHADSRFRYFCGVAWRKVNHLQDIAKSLLEAEEVSDGTHQNDQTELLG